MLELGVNRQGKKILSDLYKLGQLLQTLKGRYAESSLK